LSIRILEGQPHPLGATWTGLGVNFAVFSSSSTRVELCLFDDSGERQSGRVDLPEYTDEIWHGFLPDARPGTLYGYRAHGPYEPDAGHRFNPHKLLIDPYTKAIVGRLQWRPEIFGYHMESSDDLTFDTRDSSPFVPRSRVIDPAFTWGEVRAPATPWERTIVYEMHVRGYTIRHPEVPERYRGTFSGLVQPTVLAHLRNLGITAVELLPIHSFVDDGYLLDKGLTNYWGYNTLNFFAPARRYASVPDFAFAEFKEMVARLHDAGIEVILDVVYNHTAEGNEKGPTLSFKGLDNASYYRLVDGHRRHYVNDTGTGNTFNLSHPRVLQTVTDSLRYWVQEMKVDGFRFDLGTILAREPHGFDQGGGFLDSCRQDPVLSSVKLIAEPWDCGPGGYQVGRFPPGWGEWNDRYRDTVRRFWRGDDGQLPDVARRLTASADLFAHRGRKPWASVNFVTSHDGFTLADLVSYESKHNEANGEANRDGTDANYSANYGTEGFTDDPAVCELRLRQQRNFLATLLFSQGTPMLLAGDEMLRTQQGNNNAYAQDNEISWVDWTLTADAKRLIGFVGHLVRLRHQKPMLRRGRFLTGAYNEELDVRDVTWLTPRAVQMTPDNWHDSNARSMGVLLDGRAQETGIRRRGTDITLYMCLNAYHDVVVFTLPKTAGGRGWILRVDTNLADPENMKTFRFGHRYSAAGRSLLLFELRRTTGAESKSKTAANNRPDGVGG
jgi:isoamylase